MIPPFICCGRGSLQSQSPVTYMSNYGQVFVLIHHLRIDPPSFPWEDRALFLIHLAITHDHLAITMNDRPKYRHDHYIQPVPFIVQEFTHRFQFLSSIEIHYTLTTFSHPPVVDHFILFH